MHSSDTSDGLIAVTPVYAGTKDPDLYCQIHILRLALNLIFTHFTSAIPVIDLRNVCGEFTRCWR